MAVRVYLNKKDLISVIKSYKQPKSVSVFESMKVGTYYGLIKLWVWDLTRLNAITEDELLSIFKTLKQEDYDKK